VDRRLFAVFALTVVLLALHPGSLLVHADRPNPASFVTAEAPQVAADPCPGQCRLPGGLSLVSMFPCAGDRGTPTRTDEEVIGIGDERADALFDALSSGTARDILQQLAEEPRTPSELAEATDTSLQNVHYHTENLQEAGAIEEVSVEYSSRGREMSVYAATCRPRILMYELE
jgi:DNA-binding transcriptional ArsR family regulator